MNADQLDWLTERVLGAVFEVTNTLGADSSRSSTSGPPGHYHLGPALEAPPLVEEESARSQRLALDGTR